MEQDGCSVSNVEGCVDFMGVKVRVSRCFLPLCYLLLVSLDLKWWSNPKPKVGCPAGLEPRNAKRESVS